MNTNRSIRIRAAALLGGGVVAGVIGASALGASAETNGTPTPSSPTLSSTADMDGMSHGNETVVTGTKAATLKASALKQVPGATVDRITTEDSSDPSGAAYEVHVTKTDGTEATLLFGSNLNYLSTQTGGRHGGHDGHGHGGGVGETAVTGSSATTLKAAALKQVPGASVDEVTTDSGDAAYEVHLTKADGTHVTVKFDKALKVVNVEDGRGK